MIDAFELNSHLTLFNSHRHRQLFLMLVLFLFILALLTVATAHSFGNYSMHELLIFGNYSMHELLKIMKME